MTEKLKLTDYAFADARDYASRDHDELGHAPCWPRRRRGLLRVLIKLGTRVGKGDLSHGGQCCTGETTRV
jgi:hypothetical protein